MRLALSLSFTAILQQRLLPLIIAISVFIPYKILFSQVSTNVADFVLLFLQLFSVVILLLCFLTLSSRTLKVFWLYLSLAVLTAFIGVWLPEFNNAVSGQLAQDFVALLLYFFILLAVETNPHLSNSPLSQFNAGRLPALLFTAICFSYFILLPAEFSEKIYLSSQPSLFFHLLLNIIIFTRLCMCIVNSSGIFWRTLFGLLTLAIVAVFVDNALLFNEVTNQNKSVIGYYQQILTLMPYGLLILAANLSLSKNNKLKTRGKDSNITSYILLLTIGLLAIHLYGQKQQLFYITSSSLQSAIVYIWLLIAALLIFLQQRKTQQEKQQLQQQLLHKQDVNQQLIETNQDVSDALLNSEDKAIVGVSNNAILTVSTVGNVLSANPAALQMFQVLEQELINNQVAKLFSSQDEMYYFFNFSSNIFTLQRKKTGISTEATAVRFDGSEFPCQVELQWADRESEPLIVITFINLTDRKLAEQQTLALKDQFIANISHEFRTPLTIINGIIDRYLSQSDDPQEQDNLATAKRNGLRLVRMVEQLLELSRLSDNPKLSLNCYRIESLLAMPIDSFSRLSSERNLTFSSEVSSELWLECDAQAFENIIFNLLANAVKYTPAGGNIKLLAYREQDTIILDVIDSGIGINKKSQDEIFERFQRVDDPLNKAVFGVGIGLSLVNELVKAHGWRINLVSEQGQGSKFTLSMPLSTPVKIEPSVPISLSENEVSSILSEQTSATASKKDHSQQVILVIEDNLDMQSHIKQVIEQQHHCILASSGELGLELANEYLPDLIVCDLMLTGIDGFEVLQQIKQNEMTAHIPVILLTARSDLESRLQGLNLNADEYLSKPFNQEELLSRINSLIKNRKHLQQNYLKKFNQQQQCSRLENSNANLAQLTSESDEPASLDEQFLTKLEKLVAKHYVDPDLDITVLANELAMSERQFQRKIKVLLGTTPINFIKAFRLQKAQELLSSGAQIGRIALDVGFSSQTYFGRCFKEQFKCTPKQFQQQLKSDNFAEIDQNTTNEKNSD